MDVFASINAAGETVKTMLKPGRTTESIERPKAGSMWMNGC